MPPENKIQNKTVQTYAEDMAQVLEDNKEGLIKKVIHDEEEREIEKKNLSPESRKNKIFVVLGITLTVLAAGVLVYLFLIKKDINTVDVPPQFTPIIFTDKTTFPDITLLNKDEIITTIYNQTQATTVKPGGIEGLYLANNKKVVGFNQFYALIKSALVLPTNAKVVEDNFLLGVANNTTKDFFILIKVRTFEDIFGPMRKWEAKMFNDLYPLFGIELSASTKDLLTKDFEDGIIQNKNARVLYDQNGKIVMMYVFVDDNYVLITSTEDVTREVIQRLLSSKVKK